MEEKYYTGTIKATFKRVNAIDEEEMYDKIYKQIPYWLEIDLFDIEEIENKEEIMRDYEPY